MNKYKKAELNGGLLFKIIMTLMAILFIIVTSISVIETIKCEKMNPCDRVECKEEQIFITPSNEEKILCRLDRIENG